MNENYTNKPEDMRESVDKATVGYKSGTSRLSPFQRPVLPPSFYPFHFGKRSLKK